MKLLTLLVIAFAVYYVMATPEGAADAVKNASDVVIDGFGQLMTFFERLTA